MTQTAGSPGEPQADQAGASSQPGRAGQSGPSSGTGQSGQSGQSVTVLGYVLGGIFWLGLAVGVAATVSDDRRDLALMVVLAFMAATGGALLLIGCIAQGILLAHRERPPD